MRSRLARRTVRRRPGRGGCVMNVLDTRRGHPAAEDETRGPEIESGLPGSAATEADPWDAAAQAYESGELDADALGDNIRLYLAEIARTPLLTAGAEVQPA